MDLLLFQLAAPIGAFGAIAVGERRETATRPAHSALAGLLAAALGIERMDRRQAEFSAGLAFATRRNRLGPLLADYHTAQTPPARKGKAWATRREELAGERNTILSRRDYHTDCAFTVACALIRPGPHTLPEMEAALRRPVFTLYLGRKSCPLGLPPDPKIVEAGTLQHAFATYDQNRGRPAFADWEIGTGEIACDARLRLLADGPARRDTRRDIPVDRKTWRFDLRDEFVLAAGAEAD